MSTKTKILPFFPLNILLLNREQANLHIFEPKYQQLLEDLEDGSPDFGIPYFSKANQKQIGTFVKLVDVLKRYPDGRADILIEGIGNFTLLEYFQTWNDKLYAGGSANPLTEEKEPIPFNLLEKFLNYSKFTFAEKVELYQLKNLTINQLLLALNLNSEEKLGFLSLPENIKLKALEKRIDFLTLLFKQEQGIENNFYLN